ncbi:hypothetical protein G7046_g2532 [Stylonectria norvegica]|nr:hypothetical protein G7046_g2532 [Stylonectria norvegica]
MSSKAPTFPGFTPLSDQVFVKDGEASPSNTTPGSPKVVIIFGWGDGQARHVAKYSDGYRQLFPHAKQIVVLSPIFKALYSDLKQRSENMKPVIEAAFGSSQPATDPEHLHESEVLLHCMSNAGGVNCAATLHAYYDLFKKPLPHQLLVLDSTPGSPHMTFVNLKKMTLWGGFLLFNHAFEHISGRESAPVFSIRAINDEQFEMKTARKLYIYSKEDDIISWEDIEEHVAQARTRGYAADSLAMSGSGHVGHMRMFPEVYWDKVREAWKEAISSTKD